MENHGHRTIAVPANPLTFKAARGGSQRRAHRTCSVQKPLIRYWRWHPAGTADHQSVSTQKRPSSSSITQYRELGGAPNLEALGGVPVWRRGGHAVYQSTQMSRPRARWQGPPWESWK
mgnify:CR=1 FL=1